MKSAVHTFIVLSFLSVFFAGISQVFATDNYVPLTPIQYTFPSDAPDDCEERAVVLAKLNTLENKNGNTAYLQALTAYKECQTSLPAYLKGIYIGGVVIAGFLAVFSIVRGGFTLLFTDSILGHSEAKGIILRAIGGLLIVYASYILMNAINPQLGKDLDLSLSFPQIEDCSANGGVPSTPGGICINDYNVLSDFADAGGLRDALEHYGEDLDQRFEEVVATQQKAQQIAADRATLEERLEEGDYESVEEASEIVREIASKKVQEIEVRNYEQVKNKLDFNRIDMLHCLSGDGPCKDTNGNTLRTLFLGTRSAAQISRDKITAQQYLEAARGYVNKQIPKLEAVGLTEEITVLRGKLTLMESQYTRYNPPDP